MRTLPLLMIAPHLKKKICLWKEKIMTIDILP